MVTFDTILCIVLAIFAVLFILIYVPNTLGYTETENLFKRPQYKIIPRPDGLTSDFEVRIAGAMYHCDDSDVGGFLGYVKPDPDNPHDSKACGIYNRYGKLIGFVPRVVLDAYRPWSKCEKHFCIGWVARGHDKIPYYGRAMVFDPSSGVEVEVARYLLWIIENRGFNRLPKGVKLTIDGVRAKQRYEWVPSLLSYIEHADNIVLTVETLNPPVS